MAQQGSSGQEAGVEGGRSAAPSLGEAAPTGASHGEEKRENTEAEGRSPASQGERVFGVLTVVTGGRGPYFRESNVDA